MPQSIDETIRRFDSVAPLLREARAAIDEEWKPDPPPFSILMGEYAHAVCRGLAVLTESERRELFATVEDSLANGAQDVQDAVATCFLELLQNRASRGELWFEEIDSLLGEESRAYCEAWDRFTGATTPGFTPRNEVPKQKE